MNKDRMAELSGREIPDMDLRAFMRKVGIPQEKFEVYRELVTWETEMKAFAEHHASAIDYFSPDRQEAVKEQNQRIKEIRTAMATTARGRKKISEMAQKGIGDDTTVPYPVFKD